MRVSVVVGSRMADAVVVGRDGEAARPRRCNRALGFSIAISSSSGRGADGCI